MNNTINLGLPQDAIDNNLFKDETFLICVDPKHTEKSFHYTVWCLTDIKDITCITPEIIERLDRFIADVKTWHIYTGEKMYFTYPPTHNRLHLHIVPREYISYRPIEEIYIYDDNFRDNILKIRDINSEKAQAERLSLKFKIGAIELINVENIDKIHQLRQENEIDYLVVIRNRHQDKMIETLVNNYKYIDTHLISVNLKQFSCILNYDLKLII